MAAVGLPMMSVSSSLTFYTHYVFYTQLYI